MTPKQSRETAQAMLQALGDKAPAELREALNQTQTGHAVAPQSHTARGPRPARRTRSRHYYRAPRLPREVESAAPLAWLAALLVGGACLLSILGSCENQRAVSAWAIMQHGR
jgi:hypothetical protein